MNEDGSLLVISYVKGADESRREVLKLSVDSELLWRFVPAEGAHHDLDVSHEGEVLVLTRAERSMPSIHPRRKVMAEYITVLDNRGELIEDIPIDPVLRDSRYSFLLPYLREQQPGESDLSTLDYLHSNHVEVIERSGTAGTGTYKAGDLLLSLRNINTILILDPRTKEIIWIWGPSHLTYQHHPSLLENGNVLVFNNRTRSSQVLEVDPSSNEIVWIYSDGEEFFTRTKGSAQRLANGNTLITESDRGRAFEVTPEGKVVWQFLNPDVNDGLRRGIPRMTRFAPNDLSFLDKVN